MAIAFVANLGTAQDKTSGTTLVYTLTAGQSVAIGTRIVVFSARDYTIQQPSVADSGGNTYIRMKTNEENDTGGNLSGAIYTAHVTTALSSGSTITITYGAAITAKAMTIAVFSGCDSASTLAALCDHAGVSGWGASSTPTISDTATAAERLWVALSAKEASTNTIGAVTGWTQVPAVSTSGGGAASNVQAAGAWKISSSGAETYNPSHSSTATWVFMEAAIKPASSLAPRPRVVGQAVNRSAGY